MGRPLNATLRCRVEAGVTPLGDSILAFGVTIHKFVTRVWGIESKGLGAAGMVVGHLGGGDGGVVGFVRLFLDGYWGFACFAYFAGD